MGMDLHPHLPPASPVTSPPAEPASRTGQFGLGVLRVAGLGLLAATAGLAVLSVASFRLRCESFGCAYVGIVWVVLGAMWGLVLGLSALVVWAQRRRGLSTRLSRLVLAALALLGAGHLLYWLGSTVLQ